MITTVTVDTRHGSHTTVHGVPVARRDQLAKLFHPALVRDAFEESKVKRAGNGQFSHSGGAHAKVTPTEKKLSGLGVTGEHIINVKNKGLKATKHGITVNEYINSKHAGNKPKALSVLNYFHAKGDIGFEAPSGSFAQSPHPEAKKPEPVEEKHPAPKMKPQASSVFGDKPPHLPSSGVTPGWVAMVHKDFIKKGGTASEKKMFESDVEWAAKNHGLHPDYVHNKALAIANGTGQTSFPKHPSTQSSYTSSAHAGVAQAVASVAKAKEQSSHGTTEYTKPSSYTIGHGEYLKHSAEHAQPNTKQAEALLTYSGYFHSPLNHALRNGHHLSSEEDRVATHLDDFISKSPLNKDTTLFRGVKPVVIKALDNLKPGDSYSEPAFTSTSYNQSTATNFGHGNHLMVIRAKKGAKGAHMGKHTDHKSENEVVLPRNARSSSSAAAPRATTFLTIPDSARTCYGGASEQTGGWRG